MQAASDPIAALATPWGESALAVIRLAGSGSLERLAPLFRGRSDLLRCPTHTLHHGLLYDGDEPLDEVVVSVFRAPHSYTGEDAAEITCHGGPAVIRRVLRCLNARGFRPAEPGEFTLRAFANGRLDLTRAEAVNEIIRARTDRARALALARLQGRLQEALARVREQVLEAKAAVEACLDYPEETDAAGLAMEQAEGAEAALRRLAASHRTGRLVQEGVSVAIVGPPNAGKSTLFNALLGEDRAIVSPTPGTTRDYLEGLIEVAGIPVRLLDTAGLGETEEPLELEGMRRTERLMECSALVLYVVDATVGLAAPDAGRIERLAGRVVAVWNKADCTDRPPPPGLAAASAKTGQGLSEVRAALARAVTGEAANSDGEIVIHSDRQRELLEGAAGALRRFREALDGGLALDAAAVELEEALHTLGGLTGETTPEDVLRRMFERFCVGK